MKSILLKYIRKFSIVASFFEKLVIVKKSKKSKKSIKSIFFPQENRLKRFPKKFIFFPSPTLYSKKIILWKEIIPFKDKNQRKKLIYLQNNKAMPTSVTDCHSNSQQTLLIGDEIFATAASVSDER